MNFVTKVTDWSTYSNITITWMPLPLHIWFFLIFNLSKLFFIEYARELHIFVLR
jgi:hypothetical protein